MENSFEKDSENTGYVTSGIFLSNENNQNNFLPSLTNSNIRSWGF